MKNRAKLSDASPLRYPIRPIWLLLIVSLLVANLLFPLAQDQSKVTVVSYSEMRGLIQAGGISEITLETSAITGQISSSTGEKVRVVRAVLPHQPDPRLLSMLDERGIAVTAKEPLRFSALNSFLPWVLLLGFYIWLSRRMTDGGTGGGFAGGMPRGVRD